MSSQESKLAKIKSDNQIHVHRQYFITVSMHQQCKLVSIDASCIVYYHPSVGEMKFDYDNLTPQSLKDKLSELIG
jgi:hypothetical protein